MTPLERKMRRLRADVVRMDGRLERMCEHGIGHPVGHIHREMTDVDTVHGCDGCCKEWKNETHRG